MLPHRNNNTLLVIDDDPFLCEAIQDTFQSENLEILIAHNKTEGLSISRQRKIDIILLDQKLPDADGHLLCPALLQTNDEARIIFITAYPSFDNAVRAIKAGAHDYLSKPFELEELRLAVQQAINIMELERVKRVEAYRFQKDKDGTVLVGKFGHGQEILNLIDLAASVDSPVLITGETGTGKNMVAKAIHYKNDLKEKPFISVNCTALPETLIEDELFGHEKGAFTDARNTRKGLFEIAQGGTLFLDEIGDMPLHLQAKLLGVLDDKKIRRLGGQSFISVNVRIIAATNTNLAQRIKEKKFRQDLFYRLSVLRIHLPPLRERKNDIPELCDYFLHQFTPRRRQQGNQIKFTANEMNQIINYPWPGNVRELRNIIERSILLHGHNPKPSEILSSRYSNPHSRSVSTPVEQGNQDKSPIKSLEQIEKEHIHEVLKVCEFNYTHSAKALGISLSTLKRKLKKYGTGN